ncbi:MAG: polyketide cyclase [Cellvibrio sp. 79]|nr:MAG: polyketide cyclase [Cellvibrio sp. 79]
MTTNSVHFHRVLRTTPEKLYRAFTDADAFARWLPPCGYTAKVYHLEAKVGGSYKMSFTNFTTGNSHSFGGTYVALIPHKHLSYTATFDDPNMPGEMRTTVDITPVSCGVEIKIKQEGIPEFIPADGCYLGWQESLQFLAKLVEPEIPE